MSEGVRDLGVKENRFGIRGIGVFAILGWRKVNYILLSQTLPGFEVLKINLAFTFNFT